MLPTTEEFPLDEKLEPLLRHLAFAQDGRTVVSTGRLSYDGAIPLIDIDYFRGLPVKLVVDLLEPGSLRLCSRLFDRNHQPKSTLRLLNLTATSLDSRNSSNPHS